MVITAHGTKRQLNMKQFYFILLAAFAATCCSAQTFMMPDNYRSDTIYASSGVLTDASGAGTIGQFTSGLLYIKPMVPGTFVQLTFTGFSLGPLDHLQILNGLSTYGTQLGNFIGGSLPPTVYSTDRSGGLTLNLSIQSSYLYQGFSANIQALSVLPPADLTFKTYPGYTPYHPLYIPGGGIDLSTDICNNGGMREYASVAYSISTDTLPGADDSLLFTDVYDTIYGGDHRSRGWAVKVPNLAPGNYYLLVKIDPSNSAAESNESNNFKYEAISIVPGVHELVFSTPLSSETVYPGASFYVPATLLDIGNGPAMQADISAYLSADNILDAADLLLGTKQVHPLLAPPSYGYSYSTFTLPLNTPPGNYKVFVKADPANAISETNETNNLSSFALHVPFPAYDIRMYSGSSMPVWTQGGNYNASYTLSLTDIPYNIHIRTSVFLSADTALDASDMLLHQDTMYYSSYGSGPSMSDTLPAGISTGNYFLIFQADPGNLISETNEQNNKYVLPVQIKPYETDLQPAIPSLTATNLAMGSSTRLYTYINNTKGGNCPAQQVACYFSSDTIPDASDVLLGTQTLNRIGGNSSGWIYDTLNIPGSILPGQYYVLVVADQGAIIDETNEANNVSYLRVNISAPYADLENTYCGFSYGNRDTIPRGIIVTGYTGISNTGNIPSGTTYTRMLLSADAVPDASDIVIATKVTGSIGPASSAYLTFNLSFPSSVPDGDYYLISYADHSDTLPEPDETDNYKATKLILGAGSGTTFNFATSGSVTHTTCGEVIYDSGGNGNYHNGEHGSLTLYPGITGNFIALDFLFLDLETCCDRIDIYNGPSAGDPLIGSYSMTPSRIVSTHPSGALTLKFFSNASTVKSGFKAVASCVPYAAADLAFSTFWGPASCVQGAVAHVSYNCTNTGTITAPASFTGFYLSADSVYSNDDLFLGDDLYSHVLPGAANYDDVLLNIPLSVTPGNYYLLLKADHTNLIAETDEGNNWHHNAITVHPATIDLRPSNPYIVSSYYGPVIHYPGGSLLVSTSVSNILYKGIDTSVVRYFISTDTLLDVWDIPVDYSYRGSASPTLYFSHGDTVPIPPSLLPGQYFLLVQADALNMFTETNEGNNISYGTFMVEPATMDMRFSHAELSNYTPVPGGSTHLSYYIEDAGNIPFPYTASVARGIYLSADSIFDASDILLGGSSATIFTPGGQTLSIPTGISPGNYYIILRADTLNAYSESDEANNFAFMPINIFPNIPDLAIEGLYTGTRTILEGYWLNISFSLQNLSYGDAPYHSVHYYLSADSVLDASDTLLSTTAGTGAPGNSSMVGGTNEILPAGLSGNYYVIVVLDLANTVIETDETNNTGLLPVTIEPLSSDLLITHPSAAVSALAPGATTRVKSSFELYGNATLNNQTIGYYLSADTLLDASDVYLSSTTAPWLSHAPYYGISYTSGTITIPAGTAYGAYYVLFVADHNHITTETNEANNLNYTPLAVTAPAYDLRVSALRTDGTAAASGSSITATPVLFNAASAGTASYKVGFYLSLDSMYDASDLFLSQRLMNPLNPGNSDSAACTLNIPVSIAAGDYYLVAYADYLDVIPESAELNNFLSRRIYISQGFNEVFMNGVACSWGGGIVTSATGLTMYYTNRNVCNLYQFNLKTAFYFSADTIPGPSDAILGIQNTAMLSPGQQFSGNLSFSLPAGTSPGKYYVIAFTDYLNYIPETDETNNIRYIELNYNTSGLGNLNLHNLVSQDTMNLNVTETVSADVRAEDVAMPSSQVGYFLSADWQLDNVDLLISAVDSGAVPIWSNKTVEAGLLLPTWITPGIYYLIAAADYKNLIKESRENDNTAVKAIYVSNVTGIVEHSENFGLILYPNPASGRISFKGHFAAEEWGEELKLEILDLTGAVVYSDAFRNTVDVEKTISVSEASNGIYFLKISGNRKSASGKYVKVN
ncbi:MAG: hypothetical protein JWO09_2631 [Bacteroidetes bacterium]|nr:hypothetical protein [Bacteroidota bacterium]